MTITYTDIYLNTLKKRFKGESVIPLDIIPVQKKNPEGDITVFPNPVKDNVRIEITNYYKGYYKISVLSLSGTIVKQTTIYKNNHTIKQTLSLHDLANGYYLLRVDNGISKYTKLIIKI